MALDLPPVHPERIDLPVMPTVPERTPRVCDRGLEANAAVANVACLALDAGHLAPMIHRPATALLAPGYEHGLAQLYEGSQNDGLGGFAPAGGVRYHQGAL